MPRARVPIIPITVCLCLKYNILLVHDKAKLFNSNEAKSVSGLRELIIDTKFSRQRVSKFNHALRTGQSGLSDLSYLLNLVYRLICQSAAGLTHASPGSVWGGEPF